MLQKYKANDCYYKYSYCSYSWKKGGIITVFFPKRVGCSFIFLRVNKTFTLIELIIVIAIIAILAAIIAPNAFRAIEKAKVARAISETRTIKTAALDYYSDTGNWPPTYGLTSAVNPFLTDPGVSGWDGPYVEKWNPHPWGGNVGWEIDIDLDDDGINDGNVLLDDDRPGTSYSDNQGRIPLSSMIKIDETIDDGNLATGYVQGDGRGLHAASGELVIMVIHDGAP